MPKLDYIRISKDKKLLLLGVSEEGERYRFTVSEGMYISIGSPTNGSILSDEDLSLIRKEDERIRASKKALSLLSYSDNNEKQLTQKLVRSGFSFELSDSVAKEMVSLGYIDEDRQLCRLILKEANTNLLGYRRILPKLISRGYSSKKIKEVTERLVKDGEISFKENAKKLIEKRLSKNATTEEKKTLLYKNGYSV